MQTQKEIVCQPTSVSKLKTLSHKRADKSFYTPAGTFSSIYYQTVNNKQHQNQQGVQQLI